MEITLFTLSTNEFWFLNKLTAPNKMEYCVRWGLQMSMRKLAYPYPWGLKGEYILNTLNECDWLWFMGADTLIMNQTIDVKTLIDDQYDFIIGKDVNGINNDVFFLKNSVASREFMKAVVDQRLILPDDQHAMKSFMGVIPNFKYNIVSQKLFNAYLYSTEPAYASYPGVHEGDFKPGDFVLHFPGMDNIRRQFLINKHLPGVIK